MRTYVAKGEEAEALKLGAQWFVLDATDKALGRLATKAARILIGKDKPSFTPYLDSGDHVVVINADKMRMTGNKVEQKVYYSHSGYPGGLKAVPANRIRESEARLGDSRSRRGHAAEEQVARPPGQEIADLPRCGWFGAACRAEAAGGIASHNRFPRRFAGVARWKLKRRLSLCHSFRTLACSLGRVVVTSKWCLRQGARPAWS